MRNSEIGPEGFPVPNGAPAGFVEHAYRRSFVALFPTARVWGWLNDPATFVEGQVWPFRVEFVDGGFEPGVLNVHHGPFLNVAGPPRRSFCRPPSPCQNATPCGPDLLKPHATLDNQHLHNALLDQKILM